MKKRIKRVCVIGANGSMGAQISALFASFGNATVHMVSRDKKKAVEAKQRAAQSVRSDVVLRNLIPTTYSSLSRIIPRADLILESVAEDVQVKTAVNNTIARYATRNQIIASTTSSISITHLAQNFDPSVRERYLGLHFFNPPYKMLLCEVIPTSETDEGIVQLMSDYLRQTLGRVVVRSADTPGFIANRIGFHTLHLALQFAQKKKSVHAAQLESLLGRPMGRSLGPFRTVDLVGLHIHQSIIRYLASHIPEEQEFYNDQRYSESIQRAKTPFKSFFIAEKGEQGDVRQVFNMHTRRYEQLRPHRSESRDEMSVLIRDGLYHQAFQYLLRSQYQDANIMKFFLIHYVCYAFSLVGTVTPDYRDLDRAMGYGFNWLPPSAVVDLLGGVSTVKKLAQAYHIPFPQILNTVQKQERLYTIQSELDYRSFIKA